MESNRKTLYAATLLVGPWSLQPESRALVDPNHVELVARSEPGWDLCQTDIASQSCSRAIPLTEI